MVVGKAAEGVHVDQRSAVAVDGELGRQAARVDHRGQDPHVLRGDAPAARGALL